ncbi:endonuclease/exonuclease/phosphatase family protein [Rodentibacter caecimuris]|uniref:Endonuclease/exonuclease/phosphatase domain-containing protein n=1 Tax=Rodentibacter caecimuris TaxID=1796644 RepID=A0ABX3KXD3_9PAST|nr:hypothetical protein BKG89_05465 [Rodentibacter heylii]
MRKVVKASIFFTILSFITAYYFYRQIAIFDPIRIQFRSIINSYYKEIPSIKKNLQCYETDKELSVLPKKTFRLITWNIHKGQDQGWQRDLQGFEKNSDFILLQEATEQQNLSSFSEALSVSAFSYRGMQSGVTTLSRFPVNLYCAGSEKEPWILIPKVANAIRLPLEKQDSLLIINLHLINFEWYPESYLRQLNGLFSLVDRHQGPVILAGDFNSWNERRYQVLQKLIKQYGFSEVSYEQDVRLQFLDYPLDHVFTKGIKTLKATSVSLQSSDHNPILLEFELYN